MTREQIEDDIKRLKDAHAEDEGNFSLVLTVFLACLWALTIYGYVFFLHIA